MPPRRSRPPATRDEALSGFLDRLENAAVQPNINRIRPMDGAQSAFILSQDPNRILFGGNQSGKTFIGTYDDCLVLAHKHPYRQHFYGDGPISMRFIGVDFERGIDQGAIPYFAQMLPPSVLTNGSWEDSYSPSTHMLTLADGSTCSFMSYEQSPNKFQIVRLHHIHYDEEPPKPIFDEGLPRLLRYNGTWTISETPVQQLEWIQDELMVPAQEGRRPDIKSFFLDTRNNIHLSEAAVATLVSSYSAEEQVVRLTGGYKAGSLVFPEFERSYPFVISKDFLPIGDDWLIYESMDHGLANPTCWLWTAVHRDGSIVTFRCLYGAGIVIKDWAAAVLMMRDQIRDQLGFDSEWMPAGTVGDPAIGKRDQASGDTVMTVQQVYASHGVYIGTEGIVAARTGNQNVGLDMMRTYMKPRRGRSASTGEIGEPWWQITANCTALIDELKKARKPKQTLKLREVKNESEQIRDKDNHAIDAAKYLFVATGDLRPPSEQVPITSSELPAELRYASGPPPVFARDINDATISSHNPWSTRTAGGSDYAELEG